MRLRLFLRIQAVPAADRVSARMTGGKYAKAAEFRSRSWLLCPWSIDRKVKVVFGNRWAKDGKERRVMLCDGEVVYEPKHWRV